MAQGLEQFEGRKPREGLVMKGFDRPQKTTQAPCVSGLLGFHFFEVRPDDGCINYEFTGIHLGYQPVGDFMHTCTASRWFGLSSTSALEWLPQGSWLLHAAHPTMRMEGLVSD